MRKFTFFSLLMLAACAIPTPIPSAAYSHAPSASMIVVGRTAFPPLYLHQGIWYDVAACLKIPPEMIPSPMSVYWAGADSIYSSEGWMAYGMADMPPDVPPAGIIIEWPFWLYPTVISHEVIHVLTGIPGHPPIFDACTIPSPFDLPERWVESAR